MSESAQQGRKTPGKENLTRKVPATTKTTRGKSRETEKSSSKQALTEEMQAGVYEKAMKLLHAGSFAWAKDMFVEAALGPNLGMAHSARVYRLACERRLASSELRLSSPEDHYDYAITLINRRDLDKALNHLEQALRDAEGADHVHYALALSYGLKGDAGNAAAHLKRAIELHARNRAAARNDPDFQVIARQPQIKALLYSERGGSG